jgi:RNA polymerase sigma-70 factor (sigma-E family)
VTFDEFVRERLRPLLRTATAMCGDPGLAEDLVQDILLKTYVRWESIRVLDVPDAYVRRMLVNEYLSWRRKWARITPSDHIDPPDTDPDYAAQHADRDALRTQLAQLPRQQRVVLALRYYGGLSDAEIADAMRCSPSTVRSYASRALTTLRTAAATNRLESKEVGHG